jgi:predicted Zn-dependent peptidase
LTSEQISHLPNGLTIATERVPSARSVAASLWVAVGARDESAAHSGITHLVEHMVFKGTSQRSSRDLTMAAERFGGDLNAVTSKEYTAFETRLPAEQAELAVELLADLATRARLNADDLESEKQVVIEELAMDADLPDDRVHTLLSETLFGDHPLGRETAGSPQTVAAFSAEDLRGHVDRWYRPERMVLAAAGNIDHDQICAAAMQQFERENGQAVPSRTTPPISMGQRAEVNKDVEQTHLAMALPGLPRGHRSREALDVLNHVLGGGPASRLFDQIREQRGLAYSVYSSVASYNDLGVLVISVGTSPKHLADVESVIAHELARLVAEPLSDEELEVAIGFLTGMYVLGLEDTGARAGRLGAQLTLRGQLLDIDDQIARYRAVTAAEVRDIASELLSVAPTVAIVGPRAKGRRNARK